MSILILLVFVFGVVAGLNAPINKEKQKQQWINGFETGNRTQHYEKWLNGYKYGYDKGYYVAKGIYMPSNESNLTSPYP